MECKSETCSCGPSACSCGAESGCPECGTGQIRAQMISSWHAAFHEAMHEAQVARLRKRIDESMGPTMDKVSDAVFETVSKVFQSKIAESEAKRDLGSRLQRIFSESGRR